MKGTKTLSIASSIIVLNFVHVFIQNVIDINCKAKFHQDTLKTVVSSIRTSLSDSRSEELFSDSRSVELFSEYIEEEDPLQSKSSDLRKSVLEYKGITKTRATSQIVLKLVFIIIKNNQVH